MLTGTNSLTLSACLSAEVAKALRAGMPLENVIATLISMAEIYQANLPIAQAALEGQRGSPCG